MFCDTIEVFEHPNAQNLELGKIGTYQVVVGRGLYKTGDLCVFAPKRSILPLDLRPYFVNEETGKSYLKGIQEDRVGSIRLRGEESEGAILPMEWVGSKLDNLGTTLVGQDISGVLGITEYIPGTQGTPRTKGWGNQGDIVENVSDAVELDRFVRHDVEQFRIFEKEFIPGEPVVVTEKIHGSQINIIKDKYGKIAVTSKGRAEKNLVLREYPVSRPFSGKGFKNKIKSLFKWVFNVKGPLNEYWRVARDSGIIELLENEDNLIGKECQVIGEVVPFQSGFSYGQTDRTVLVFRVVIDTIEKSYGKFSLIDSMMSSSLPNLQWVPLLYSGPYDLDKIKPLAEGKETVSGCGLHIREGIVLTPATFRKTAKGVPLLVKILNSKYKNNDEDPV